MGAKEVSQADPDARKVKDAQSGAAGVALATLADWPIEDVTPESR